MTNETIDGLKRVSWLPDDVEPANGTLIAGQEYYDVEFTGGAAANLVLTDCTINGTETARNEEIVTSGSSYSVAAGDYVITINKTVGGAITVTLPATPSTSRSIIVKDGKGDAATNNITIDGNGQTIDSDATLVMNRNYQSIEIIYNGTEWNVIGEYVDGFGDVAGPSSADDNAIARFDGSSGKLIQNSLVTIADSTGVISGTKGVTISGSSSGATALVAAASAGGTVTLPAVTDTLAGISASQTLTNKVINGANNTITNVSLATGVTGNLPVTNLNGGSGASSASFWRGDGTWANVNAGGDVVGPASATDNAVARYDSTTGKLIQNSAVTIADTTGVIAGTQGVVFSGSSSGTTTLQPSAAASGTLTLPANTDTLVARATTDTLTNKTISGAANTITNVDLATAVTGRLPLSNIVQGAGLSVLGVNGSSTANYAAITSGGASSVLRTNDAGTDIGWGAINLSVGGAATGNLPIARLNNGTNASALTYWRGDGIWDSPGQVGDGTSGQLTYYAATGNTISGNLNANISAGDVTFGRAAGTSYITSIQQVSITIPSGATSATATISSVNTARTFISYQGKTETTAESPATNCARVTLTNATTVTATRNTSSATDSVTINAVVIEGTADLISSVEYGTVSISASHTGTATVSSVTTSRSAVFYLGHTTTATASNVTFPLKAGVTLTNSTTVTGYAGTASFTGTYTISFVVVQFAAAAISSIQQLSTTGPTANSSVTKQQTITTVNPSRSFIAYGGQISGYNAISPEYDYATLEIADATTVNMTVGSTSGAASLATAYYAVIEFAAGVLNSNVQRGLINLYSATTNTATISSISTSYGFVNFAGNRTTNNDGTNETNTFDPRITLTNSTTITATRASTSSTDFDNYSSYETVEFVATTTPTAGTVTLYGTTSGSSQIKAAATTSGGTVFTLPANNGTNGYYLQTNGSGVTSWAAVSGSGDVVGPASSTDNAIARFDLTTGKLLQNSSVTISDAGLLTVDNIQTSGSSGVIIKNSGGTTVATLGSANTTNVTFEGAVNINGSQAATSASNTQTLTNKTLTDAVNTVSTPTTTSVGYLGAPQNLALDSGDYTLVITDSGKSIDKTVTNARTLTIPANASVAFPIGTIITGSNEGSAGSITMSITSDTLKWGASTGSRTIAINGSWTLKKITSTSWRLTGDGIT